MDTLLNEAEFTERLAEKLRDMPITVSVSEPLSIKIAYGPAEPVLTIKLTGIYEQYKEEPAKLDVLLTPFLTEIGWTVHEPRTTARAIAEQTMPLLRDLLTTPLTDEEKQSPGALPKGPLLYQDLVERPEEHIVVQFVLWNGDSHAALRTGDILPCFPDMRDLANVSIENLKRLVQQVGVTLSEFPVENFKARCYMAGLRDPKHKNLTASLMMAKAVMQKLEESVQASDGLICAAPATDQLLISADTDETSVCELGLLAQFLKRQASSPISSFVWRFRGGVLERVQTVDTTEMTADSDGGAEPGEDTGEDTGEEAHGDRQIDDTSSPF